MAVAAMVEGPTVELDTPAVSVLAISMAVLADTGCSVSLSTMPATAAHAAANSPRRFHALVAGACPSVSAGSDRFCSVITVPSTPQFAWSPAF
jgi:hypothetical protein